ncbi:MAG TPA: hypothetical protein VFM05_01130, partial [Candidatus Saccharimonadales bacterium]|nr:hypothetical protein [Candidatus Saccharimonadales bacterium]
SEEKATRPVRPCRCLVLEIPQMAQTDEFAHIAPGTVTAFVAREGEPLLGKLTKAIQANDSKNFNLATDQIKKMAAKFSRKIAGARIHAKSRRRAVPSFVEINYASKPLASHAHVDDVLRVHVHAFAYNGGYLDRSKFSMVEYYRAGDDTPLTCVLLIRQPILSEIEREALRLVPSNSSVNNIAVEIIPPPFTPAVAAFLEAATPVAARWVRNEFNNWFVCILVGRKNILASIPDAVLQSKDFQNKLKSLPPEVAAAELLRLRTDILLQQPPK